MPDSRHHDPHIEGKLIDAGLREEFALKEHAGSLAKLNDRARHALGPESKVRRGVERDGVKKSRGGSLRTNSGVVHTLQAKKSQGPVALLEVTHLVCSRSISLS